METSDQLELAFVTPYTLRFSINESLAFFWNEDWQFTVKARSTKRVFDRFKEFFHAQKLRYVDEISKHTIEALRRWLKELGFADATINSHHVVGTRWFNFMYECKEAGTHGFKSIPLPTRNPWSLVPKVSEAQFAENVAWPKKVVRKIVRIAIGIGDLDLAEIVEFLYEVPIRQCDLFRMTDRNVNLAQGIVQGVQKKLINRKNPSGHPYLNVLTGRATTIVKRRLERARPGEALFDSRDLQNRWERLRALAGYPKMKLKQLRPSHSSLLMDNGTDVETVKNVLGHTTLRMIPSYRQMSVSHLKKAAKIISDDKTELMEVK